jgi:hypothetical protein
VNGGLGVREEGIGRVKEMMKMVTDTTEMVDGEREEEYSC